MFRSGTRTHPMNMRLCAAVLVLASTFVVVLRFTRTSCKDNTSEAEVLDEFESNVFAFIPKYPQSLGRCEDLFDHTDVAAFNLSKTYYQKFPQFHAAVGTIAGHSTADGHIWLVPKQFLTMHYLASQPFVHTVCETGFNKGHSAFNYLTANDRLVVHSFDIGHHGYTVKMADYLSKEFPQRLFLHIGDSAKTVPAFIKQNPGIKCDLMFVDGGHFYLSGLKDIFHFASVASLETGNVIVLDDYPAMNANSVRYGKAWDDAVRWKIVNEAMRCSFATSFIGEHQSAFVIGRVAKRPLNSMLEMDKWPSK